MIPLQCDGGLVSAVTLFASSLILVVFGIQGKSAGPVTKEGLGRATWTFLHTLGAQVIGRYYTVWYPIKLLNMNFVC